MNKEQVVKMDSILEMVGFLKTNGTACRFVSLVSQTPVVKIKVANPFGQKIFGGKVVGDCKLFKVSSKIGIINANYNTSVRNRIADKLGVKIGDVEYDNGEVWYEHLKTPLGNSLPLVVHKTKNDGKYYLQYFPHKSTNKYANNQGETIPDEQVKPYLYAESERPDFKPSVISVNLENVKQLKASGVVIEMPDFEEAEAILAD